MNKYVKMMGFVSLLGIVSGGLLFGANAATNDLITTNSDVLLKEEVLIGHGYSTFTNIHDFFNATTTVVEVKGEYTDQYKTIPYTYTFYKDNESGKVTFGFGPVFGGGVWGPIIGLLSLNSDFSTIIRVSVLQQEETPGLGGIVATRAYLDQFEGRTIGLGDDALSIIKDLDLTTAEINEVRSITGATRTSYAFEDILNKAYAAYLTAWQSYLERGE